MVPLPAIAGAASLALPYLKKIPGLLNKATKSEHFWKVLLPSLYVGGEVVGQFGKAGERGLSREEIALRKYLAASQAEATKMQVTESRERAKEYTDALLKMRQEDKQESRKAEALQSFMGSQDRQMAMVLQAIQGISAQRPQMSGPGGMVGLMRGGF